MLCVLSCQKTLGADLPQELKPGAPDSFWCTNRTGAEQVAIAFRENKFAQSQAKDSDIDFVLLGECVFAGIISGIVIDRTLLNH